MGRKLTNEEFLQKLDDLGRDDLIPLEEYKGANVKIKWKCTKEDCQHEWETTPNTVLTCGTGCPKCGVNRGNGCKPKSKRELQEICTELKRDVIILSDYKGGKNKIKVKCTNPDCNHEWEISYRTLKDKRKQIKCPICHKKEIQEKFKLSNEEAQNRIKEVNSDIEMIGDYINYYTPIRLKCKIDGYEWEQTLSNFIKETPYCPLCEKDKTYRLIPGVNDLATLRPDLIKYFINKEDASKVKLGSNIKMKFKCPDCGYKKELCVYVLEGIGFSCPKCKDNISFPNKFLKAFLNQLNIEYDLEWSTSWCSNYKYDAHFYLNNKEYVVEIDGEYHSEDCLYFKTQVTSVIERDAIKTKLAQDNNCILIRIDCKESTVEYAKKNIISSKFNDLFDLSKIDWQKCGLEAEKSLVIQVCEYFNNHLNSTLKEIANKFKISVDTVSVYLKKGRQIGITLNLERKGHTKIITILKNGIKIKTFASEKELINNFIFKTVKKDRAKSIISKILNTNKTLEGYTFITAKNYKDLTEKFIKEHTIKN